MPAPQHCTKGPLIPSCESLHGFPSLCLPSYGHVVNWSRASQSMPSRPLSPAWNMLEIGHLCPFPASSDHCSPHYKANFFILHVRTAGIWIMGAKIQLGRRKCQDQGVCMIPSCSPHLRCLRVEPSIHVQHTLHIEPPKLEP